MTSPCLRRPLLRRRPRREPSHPARQPLTARLAPVLSAAPNLKSRALPWSRSDPRHPPPRPLRPRARIGSQVPSDRGLLMHDSPANCPATNPRCDEPTTERAGTCGTCSDRGERSSRPADLRPGEVPLRSRAGVAGHSGQHDNDAPRHGTLLRLYASLMVAPLVVAFATALVGRRAVLALGAAARARHPQPAQLTHSPDPARRRPGHRRRVSRSAWASGSPAAAACRRAPWAGSRARCWWPASRSSTTCTRCPPSRAC